jgi:hypothetical protein
MIKSLTFTGVVELSLSESTNGCFQRTSPFGDTDNTFAPVRQTICRLSPSPKTIGDA